VPTNADDPIARFDIRARLASVLGFRPAAVIFDMDGVLAETEPINERASAAVLARRGANLTAVEYRSLAGQSNDVSWAWIIDRCGLTDSVAILGQEYVQELIPLLTDLVPSPGVLEMVVRLRASGVLLAVGSSSPRAAVDAVLNVLNLTHAFDAVVTGDDVTHGKPAPDIFRLTSEQLSVEPGECLVIEDSPSGLEAAARAGMPAVAVVTRYIPREALSANLVVDSLEWLLEVSRLGDDRAAGRFGSPMRPPDGPITAPGEGPTPCAPG
jgi:HAD superfamily hydrolase (TIGR01509 family)